jgi:hypothetical protein
MNFKSSEVIMMSARGGGKSRVLETWQEETRNDFRILDQGTVDGKPWYTVRCGYAVSKWIRMQPVHQWCYSSEINIFGDIYDISEEIYILLILTWS